MVRLACAVQYFSGSLAYIMSTNDLSHIEYPSGHIIQQSIASGFESVSSVSFSNSAGCIDGLLLWIQKPSEEQAKKAGIGRKNSSMGEKTNLG
ncbi:hypothetical protein ACHAW6_009918 [Cyclotella cf. meneghiniana]